MSGISFLYFREVRDLDRRDDRLLLQNNGTKKIAKSRYLLHLVRNFGS